MVANYPREPVGSDTKDGYAVPCGEWDRSRIAFAILITTILGLLLFANS